MAELHRCATFLMIALSCLITGCRCQCDSDGDQIMSLHAVTYDTKVLSSPGYPSKYPNSIVCQWKLVTSPGYVIHLHVNWMELEQSAHCRYDAVTFYDGRTAYHDRIRKICSAQERDFYSSANYMVVKFESDFSIAEDGFQLEYSAIRPSQVPATVPPSYPWPYPVDTTTRITTTTTPGDEGNNWPSYNIAALVGGLTGGLVLLFVLCALARYSFSHCGSASRRQTARPYPPPSVPAPAHPSSTIYHNNSSVFMVSASSTGHHLHPNHHGGATNLAFSPHGEAPPAYFSVQHSTTVVQPGGSTTAMMGAFCPPPPSYTEAMRYTHPAILTAPAAPPPFSRDVEGQRVGLPPVRASSSTIPAPGDVTAAPVGGMSTTVRPPIRRSTSTPPVFGDAAAPSVSPPVRMPIAPTANSTFPARSEVTTATPANTSIMVPPPRTTTSSPQGPRDVTGTPVGSTTAVSFVQPASATGFDPTLGDISGTPNMMASAQPAPETSPAPTLTTVRRGTSSEQEQFT